MGQLVWKLMLLGNRLYYWISLGWYKNLERKYGDDEKTSK